MNVQLPLVVTDITGVTGMRILRDIVAGQRDPHHLAEHRDPRCHASKKEIIGALTGNYRPEHLFVLQQNLELFDLCQQQLAGCDQAIAAQLQTLTASVATPTAPVPPPRITRKPQDNEPAFELRTPLHHLTGGVDLTQIDGIKPYAALKLIAEIGIDMRRWTTEKHFTSWRALAPQNKISGGRLLSSRTQPSANRAAAILRLSAMSVGKTQTALGAFYRRLAARIGKPHPPTCGGTRIRPGEPHNRRGHGRRFLIPAVLISFSGVPFEATQQKSVKHACGHIYPHNVAARVDRAGNGETSSRVVYRGEFASAQHIAVRFACTVVPSHDAALRVDRRTKK